jgi:serine protease
VKTTRFLAAALLAGLFAAAPHNEVQAAPEAEASDRIIVQWVATQGETPDEVAETQGLASRHGKRLAYGRPLGGRMSLLRLERRYAPAEMEQTLSALRADPRVAIATPDRRVRAHAYVPNDPLFAGQWFLKGTQPSAMRVDTAWDITRGGASPSASTVVVAVLDTGVRFDHPDLGRAANGGKLLPGYDFVSADAGGLFATSNDGDGWDGDATDPGDYLTATDLANPPFKGTECGKDGSDDVPVDSSWHGTRVAGLIAANSDNSTGIAGAGFNIRVLPVRVLGRCGGYDSDVLAGMYWASGLSVPPPLLVAVPPVNPNPAQVINMSLGGTGPCTELYAAAVKDITAHGVLVVVSAGNEGTAVDSPANCAGAVAVAGLRHVGSKVGYSNLGPDVAIAAPAGNCVLTGVNDPCLYSLDTTTNAGKTTPTSSTYTDQFRANVGTSFSAPLVAATAGLMKAVNPRLTPAQLVNRLKSTARAFPTVSDTSPSPPACVSPAVDDDQSSECFCNTQVCGAGMLDSGAAVNAALRPTAVAQVLGTIIANRKLDLDGTGSGASVNRSLTGYQWSVVSVTGGASSPVITNANQALASVNAPATGSYTLQLAVTDNIGATDTVQVSVTAPLSGGGTDSTNPPPTANGSSGGGAFSPVTLGALTLLLLFVACRRRRA